MNQFSILTSLPTSLACSVLRDWLSLKAVAALDIAYCNKVNRRFFEALLHSDEYYIREEVTLLKRHGRLCNIWNGLSKCGGMLRSVLFQGELSEAQGRLVAQHCSNLTHVNFRMQNCPPALWSILGANRNIEHMYLNFNLPHGTQKLFPTGMSLPALRALAMVGYNIQHVHIVEALKLSNNIARLDIFGSIVNESTVLQIAQLCPQLTALGLACGHLNEDVLSQLTRSCPHILHFSIQGLVYRRDESITDAGLLAVVQNLKGLQSLDIKNNYRLTDASLVHIYTHCADTLKTLHMNCKFEDGIGDLYGATAVHELLERCTKLRTFTYRFISDNTMDNGFTIPAATLGNLTELVLSGNIACERNLAAISQYGINLQTLGFYDVMDDECSDAAWMGLLQGCPKLTELYVNSRVTEIVLKWTQDRPELIVGTSLPVKMHRIDVLNM